MYDSSLPDNTIFGRLVLLVIGALSLPFALATAGSQFNLDVYKHPSACWIKCHETVIPLIHTPTDPLAITQAITGNCQLDSYLSAMGSCLVSSCISAPDAAYGVEYGRLWCSKAGVDVSQKLALPETYTQGPASSYFQSAAYLAPSTSSASRSSSPHMMLTFIPLGSIVYWVISSAVSPSDAKRYKDMRV